MAGKRRRIDKWFACDPFMRMHRSMDWTGVYVMYDENDRVLYVGSSFHLGKRFNTYRGQRFTNAAQPHIKEMLSKVYYAKYRRTRGVGDHLRLEYRLIHRLCPPYNRRFDPVGRKAVR